jgi:hypothetical protein
VFGETVDDLKFAWRLCRKARSRGKYRPFGSYPIGSDTDTGYVWHHAEKTYVVANGSDNFLEWIKNTLWFRWGRDMVAVGFLKTAVEFADNVEDFVHADEPLIFIGHSRGTFIQKTALEMIRRGYRGVESVVTFGGPKIAGAKFCRNMADECVFHVRVFSPDDPVPTLPKIRGRHYETVSVTFPRKRDLFSIHRASRFVRGIVDHLSYGVLLNGKTIWKYSQK